MNIGYVYGFNSYPPAGGGGVHAYNLAHNLTLLGHRVHAFEPERNAQCIVHPQSVAGVREFLSAIDVLCIRIDGSFLSRSTLKLQCLRGIGPKPIVWEVNAPTDETLARLRFEALSRRSPAAPLVKALKNIGRDVSFRLTVGREDMLRRWHARKADAAICMSESLKAYAESALRIPRCEIVPNGSDPAMFAGAKGRELFPEYADHYKVIYAGASQWFWQGVDIISTLAAMAERRADKILFIVLDNSLTEPTVKGSSNVRVISRVGYFDVPDYLACADACLCLYHDFAWCRYGFYLSPLKLYDYMAAGKPVIASRLGQIAAVIEDGTDGLLVSDDPEDIYEKILFCRDSGDGAKRMGELARQKVIRHYNWRRAADSTLEVFQSVLRHR